MPRTYGKNPERKEFLRLAPKLQRQVRPLATPQIWQPGQTLDQGNVGACISFSGTQDLNATPYPHNFDSAYALAMYWEIKAKIDGEPNVDDGSTHESLVKELQNRGFISQNGFSISQDMTIARDFVNAQSPVLLGTVFYYSMETPDANGIITADPSSGIAGGHSYLWIANQIINGIAYAVIQNSWGIWGVGFRGIASGFAYLAHSDIAALLALPGNNAGDVLAFVEVNAPIPTPQPSGCLPKSIAKLLR